MPRGVDRKPARALELANLVTERADRPHKGSAAGELVKAVIVPVIDPDVARMVDSDCLGFADLSSAAAARAKCFDKAARG